MRKKVKKTIKKAAEILLIVILCVFVTRFFITKEQEQKNNKTVFQENNLNQNGSEEYSENTENRNDNEYSENSQNSGKKNRKKNKNKKSEDFQIAENLENNQEISDNNNYNNRNNNNNFQKVKSSGNRKYKIDYDHIIGGDINSSGEKVTGGHTLLRGDVRIIKKIGNPASNGVYRANVEIKKPDGKWQKKTSNGGVNTMFPEDWDEARVIDEINSAWENRKELKGRDSNMWQGVSKSGVVIRGYKSPRITAYPVYGGER